MRQVASKTVGPPQAITVEEGMDLRQADSRFFSLTNNLVGLNVIIANVPNLLSCKLKSNEIVVHKSLQKPNHEAWAISERPLKKVESIIWNSHVRGTELILTGQNNYSSIIYELNANNELYCTAKLKSLYTQHEVVYFNLNNAKVKTPVDGHDILVTCNGNTNKIQHQPTRLQCQCNKYASLDAKNIIGDITTLVRNQVALPSGANEDDIIICDAIYSLESTNPQDFLSVQLRYQSSSIIFELRTNVASTAINSNTSATNNNSSTSSMSGNVSSSTNRNPSLHNDLNVPPGSSGDFPPETIEPSKVNAQLLAQVAWLNSSECFETHVEKKQEGIKRRHDEMKSDTNQPPPSSSTSSTTTNTTSTSTSSSGQKGSTSTLLRARVRITNFGICVMPVMMAQYVCSYQFRWQ